MSAIILLSPSSEDESARNIVGALSESDLDIYWARWDPGNAETELLRMLDQCRCVIILWSALAEAQNGGGFHTLASLAAESGKAILVRLDKATIPADIAKLTTYDLRGWRSRKSSLFMLDLVAAAKSKAAGLDPPLPRAPRQLLFKRLAIIVPSAVAAFALVAGLYRDIGIDRLAGPAERAAWQSLTPGSCNDLRNFLKNYQSGTYADRANSLLMAKTVQQRTMSERVERDTSIYVRADESTSTNLLPRDGALQLGNEKAAASCGRIGQAVGGRVIKAELIAPKISCISGSGGCSLDAVVKCTVEQPYTATVEYCHAR